MHHCKFDEWLDIARGTCKDRDVNVIYRNSMIQIAPHETIEAATGLLQSKGIISSENIYPLGNS